MSAFALNASVLSSLLFALLSCPYHVFAQSSTSSSPDAAASRLTKLRPISAASGSLQGVNCQAAQIYEHPNASASYAIPAVEAIGGAVVNSSKSWNLTITVGQTESVYDNATAVISRDLFLDTSSTTVVNSTAATPASATSSTSTTGPVGACMFVLSLPDQSSVEDPGDCSNIFSPTCVADLKSAVEAQARAMSGFSFDGAHTGSICNTFTDTINHPPASCAKYTDKDSHVLGNGRLQFSYLNLTSPSTPLTLSSCLSLSSPPPSSLLPFFTQTFLPTGPTDLNSTIRAQAGLTTPVLMAFFSTNTNNNTNTSTSIQTTEDKFSRANLVCARPSHLATGGDVPPASSDTGNAGAGGPAIAAGGNGKSSGASKSSSVAAGVGGSAVGIRAVVNTPWAQGAGIALGVNAVLFSLLL